MKKEHRYYISTGKKHGFYTLRETFYEPIYSMTPDGRYYIDDWTQRDWHIQNLSTDPEEAAEKAEAITGKKVKVPGFSLDDIHRRSQEEIEKQARIREEMEKARRDRRVGLIIQRGAEELAELGGEIPSGEDLDHYAFAALFRACWAAGWASPFEIPQGKHEYERAIVADMVGTAHLRNLSFGQTAFLWKLVEEIPEKDAERERKARVMLRQREAGHLDLPVGTRFEFDAEVVDRGGFEGTYGFTTIWKFQTVEGHMLTWFTGSYQEIAVGDRIQGKATVKKHEEFRGVPETHISRAKVEVLAAR